MPLFSIIIPTYNRAHLITKTVDSVLSQSFRDYEIVVIDDKSTDNTEEVMQPYIRNQAVRYFRNEQNSERAISRNRGIDEARGQYISLLDSDDILFPECLQHAANFLSSNPACRFFHCQYVFVNESHEILSRQMYPSSRNTFRNILTGNYVSNIGFFLHADTARKLRVDENPVLRGVEDYDFVIRAIAECGGAERIESYDCGILMHPQRSVFTDDWDFIYQRTMAFLQKQLNSDYFRQHYWPYRDILASHLYLYLTASSAIRKRTGKGIYYLWKAAKTRPSVLITGNFWKHFFVVIKYSVFNYKIAANSKKD
jgi:glycosyltransferase involved in cell wall biosynthesis